MSFQIDVAPKDLWAARFVGKLRRELQRAYEEARDRRGMKRIRLAEKLGVDRSQITRWLKGTSEMTMTSYAHLLWALEADIEVRIDFMTNARGNDRGQVGTQTSSDSVINTFPPTNFFPSPNRVTKFLLGNAKIPDPSLNKRITEHAATA